MDIIHVALIQVWDLIGHIIKGLALCTEMHFHDRTCVCRFPYSTEGSLAL